jgi:hypothetical protein
MTHRIAPPESPGEFYLEAGYIRDFAMRWIVLMDDAYKGVWEALDIEFVAQWQRHRGPLEHYVSMIGFNPRNRSRDVKPCLDFMDALVSDWMLQMTGKEPANALNRLRLQEMEQHQQRLNSVPGDRWGIKY